MRFAIGWFAVSLVRVSCLVLDLEFGQVVGPGSYTVAASYSPLDCASLKGNTGDLKSTKGTP